MGNGKKKKGSSGKITKFPGWDADVALDQMTDENIDDFLRECLKDEADELETQLNHDPAMIGVGASDDMYQKIVEELKKQGIWEEDEAEEVEREENGGLQDAVEKEAVVPEAAGMGSMEEEAKKNKAENTTELRAEAVTDNLENTAEAEHDKESSPLEERERIYSMLSEEDRKAMELGYQMKEQEEQKKIAKRKRRKLCTRVGAAAVAVMVLGSAGMSTEASRAAILQMCDAVLENFGIRIASNYSDDWKTKTVDRREEKAKEEIQNQLGILPLSFAYLPEGMAYSSYKIYEKAKRAALFYSYEDMLLSVYMGTNDGNSRVGYCQIDGSNVVKQTVENEQGIEISLYEIKDTDDTYAAVFEMDTAYYYFGGKMPFDEFEKIAKFIVISGKTE